MAEDKSVAIVTMANEELINSFLLADWERYLGKLESNPSRVKPLNNVIKETRVVAIPTISVLYTWAVIVQKTNPNPLNTNALVMLNIEFL